MRRSPFAAQVILIFTIGACAAGPSPSGQPSGPEPSEAATDQPSRDPAPTAAETASPEPPPEALAWSPLAARGPAAREDHTWTLDGSGETAYLFGGRDGTTAFGDTWAFDLRTDSWTQLAATTPPPARFGHEAVWVDEIGLVVFAGQADARTFFNDLWAYDPARDSWAELPAGGAVPTPRYGSCGAIGPDGRLWISHGFTEDGTRFSDTRAYDFATGTWTDETPGDGARPVERCLHGCWWTDGGELALYAGQTTGVTALDDRWILRADGWSRVEGALPPARNLYARARHESSTLVFGGQAVDGTLLGDLWLLADGAADALALNPSGDLPAERAGAELLFDPARGRALLFGGRAAAGALGDVWILTGL